MFCLILRSAAYLCKNFAYLLQPWSAKAFPISPALVCKSVANFRKLCCYGETEDSPVLENFVVFLLIKVKVNDR